MKKPYLSIVIPAYNEEHSIKRGALDAVNKYLKKQKYSWEVLIADDGSTDKTAELAEKFVKKHKNFSLLKEPHRGKAGIVIAGMLKAKGEIILFTDMDQSTPINQIEKFLPEFEKGADGAIAQRSGRKGAPPVRKIMALGFVVLRTVILRLPYKDTQAGFKAFTGAAAKKLFNKMKRLNKGQIASGASVTAGFDLELLYLSRKMGLRVISVPVEWKHEEGARGKSDIKNSIDGLKGILAVRINALRGRYST